MIYKCWCRNVCQVTTTFIVQIPDSTMRLPDPRFVDTRAVAKGRTHGGELTMPCVSADSSLPQPPLQAQDPLSHGDVCWV